MATDISREQAKLWWRIQKNGEWKNLVKTFKRSAAIHYQLNKFIKFFYWEFRQQKGILDHHYPEIIFKGFKGFDDPEQENTAGYCRLGPSEEKENKLELTIYLNQWYLLDKLGFTHLIQGEPKPGSTYYHYEVSFKKLTGTIAHELAHAYQYTVNNFAPNEKRSQCKSSGEGKRAWITNQKGKKKNKLIEPKYPELVNEHTKLTKEIKQMINNSLECQKLKKWWTTDKLPHQDRQNNTGNCENCGRTSQDSPCQECIEEGEFQRLSLLIQKSKDLTNLEKNYQTAKSNTIYNELDKKIGIDNLYYETKIYLTDIQKQNDELKKIIRISLLLVGTILIFGLIVRILPRRKRKKY